MLKTRIFQKANIKVKEAIVTIIGLSGSGKTSFLNQLLDEKDRYTTTEPTQGANLKKCSDSKGHSITFCDVGGAKTYIQSVWIDHLKGINGLVC